MKKLLALILILALALPVLALAEDAEGDEPNLYIIKHFALHMDNPGMFTYGKYNPDFPYDSYTMDLYLASDMRTVYLVETSCASGLFINSGMSKAQLVTIGKETMILYENGDNFVVNWDENGRDMWIKMNIGMFRLRLVNPVDAEEDWRP